MAQALSLSINILTPLKLQYQILKQICPFCCYITISLIKCNCDCDQKSEEHKIKWLDLIRSASFSYLYIQKKEERNKEKNAELFRDNVLP